MPLTNTTTHPSSTTIALTYNAPRTPTSHPSSPVSVTYPTAASNFRITRATIPSGSKFQIGAHWHEEYEEYMRVVQGRGKIRLGNEWRDFGVGDGEVRIGRGVVHDVCRADSEEEGEGDGVDFVWEERVEPADGSKELFFRHAFSPVADKDVFGWKLPLQQLLVLMSCDTYISIVPGVAGWYVTHGLYAVLRPVARMLGLRPFYDEYTPERLMGIRKEMEGGREKSV